VEKEFTMHAIMTDRGEALAGLYERLRDEFGVSSRGMDPNDPTRAPIAMAILEHAASMLNLNEVEVAVRQRLTLSIGSSVRLSPTAVVADCPSRGAASAAAHDVEAGAGSEKPLKMLGDPMSFITRDQLAEAAPIRRLEQP
jgi:hypothetical protein